VLYCFHPITEALDAKWYLRVPYVPGTGYDIRHLINDAVMSLPGGVDAEMERTIRNV